MRWQRLVMVCALLLVTALAARLAAQEKKDQSAARHHDRVEAMAARLGLSDEQKEKVRKIHAEFDPKVDEVEHQMWSLHHEEHEALSKVLTDSQRAKVPDLLRAEREKELDRVATELSLSDEQKQKVKQIHSEYQEKFHKLAADKDGAQHGEYRQLRHEEFAAIRHELNDSQRAKLPGILREELHRWHDASRQQRHLDALADKLDLSSDQRQQVKKIQDEYAPKMEKLTAQLRQVHHEEHEAVSKVLTDEQRAKLQDLIKSHGGGREAPKSGS